MTRRGLYGLTVPAWLGGPDLPMSAVAEVLRILATGDPNLAQLPHSHYVYVNLLRCCGSRDQQRELLSAVREGARFGNAQAEAGTRTPDQIRTTIAPDGGGYVITGEAAPGRGSRTSSRCWPAARTAPPTRLRAPHGPPATVLDDW
jgi:alkylation response protein AidB-like acyl-CoA dehydrogenase